jgi:chemotaxis signal transduction protein
MDTYIIVENDGVEYAVAVALVEVIPVVSDDIIDLPSLPSSCRGCVRHGGRLIPVYDMTTFFRSHAASEKQEKVIVIVSTQRPFGFFADRASHAVQISSDAIIDHSHCGAGKERKCIKRFINHDDSLLAVLDLEYMQEIIGTES